MEKKTTSKTKATADPITHVKATVERRHFSSEGKRLSPPPFPIAFNSVQEFDDFLKTKKGLGLFLLEVLEAPEGMKAPELDK